MSLNSLLLARLQWFMIKAVQATRTSEMTPATISLRLVPNPPPFQHHSPEVIAPIDEVVAPVPTVSTGSPSSTIVDQDALLKVNSNNNVTKTPVIPNDVEKRQSVEEDNHDIEVAHMGNDPYFGIPILEVPSHQSSSTDSIHTITYKDALTQSCWIEAMQEELNDFERLE
ncbi:hypothetical protein Tco_1544275, partial [Tanacetum coccineum]